MMSVESAESERLLVMRSRILGRVERRAQAAAQRGLLRRRAAGVRGRRRDGRRAGRRGRLGARGRHGARDRVRSRRDRRGARRRADQGREPARPRAGRRRRHGLGDGDDDDRRDAPATTARSRSATSATRAPTGCATGELEQLTDDHSLVAELVRRGELSPEEAAVHPQRSVITRALGTEADVDVDAFTVEAADGDLFLLCSDGLTTMVDAGDDRSDPPAQPAASSTRRRTR